MLSVAALQGASKQAWKQNWPDWRGQTVVCMATGPSLTPEMVQHVADARRRKVVAINRAIDWAPWCDVWYAADYKFWHRHNRDIAGQKVSADAAPPNTGLPHLINDGRVDLQIKLITSGEPPVWEPGHAVNGGHSGFQAMQLAINCGARRVLLLGYDCRALDGKRNCIDHAPELQAGSAYKLWPQCYAGLALPEGVEVVNCTPASAIDTYPIMPIERALPL